MIAYTTIQLHNEWAKDNPITRPLLPRLEAFLNKHETAFISWESHDDAVRGFFDRLVLAHTGHKRIVGISLDCDFGRKGSITLVHTDYRGQGIGKKLMSIKKPVVSYVAEDNFSMVAICRSLGMTETLSERTDREKFPVLEFKRT